MKKNRLLIITTLIICCLLALSACGGPSALSEPTNLTVEQATLTLTWKSVKDARMYTIRIESESGDVKELIASKTSYSLAQLQEGNYTIKIKANGKSEVNEDSGWSEPIAFTREHEPGMVFKLIQNGTAYEVANKGIATGDIVIPDTYRGLPVTSIGEKAFFNKSDVTSVALGNNIKSIGKFAFANCSYLTHINLPDGLTTLGESAFASCRLLAGEMIIPEGVTTIPAGAFAYCAQLTSVQLGDRVTDIGANAFADCKGIVSIALPDSVISVGEYAFSNCHKVTEVRLGQNLSVIGAYVFSGMESLTAITLPESVSYIGEGAFYHCTALSDVALGTGIRTIDQGAFADTALWEHSATNEVYVGRWLLGLKDTTSATVTFREDTVGIANYAFYRNNKLTDVFLPNAVKYIGDAAFALTKINNVVIGSGVESIGEQAFTACANLSTVILGSYNFDTGSMEESSLLTIGAYAFRECSSLVNIEIPSTVKQIGTYAFRDSGMYKLNKDGVVYAGNWLVDYTSALSGEVEVRRDTAGIADYAFYECNGLTGISMPNTVKIVGRAAFYKCKKLTTVTLPETLQVIDDYTFYHCDRLKLFALPPMLKVIGRSAFYKCGSVYEEGEADTDRDTLIIPVGVEVIGDYAFYGCGQESKADLESEQDTVIHGIDIVILGDGVKHIGEYAFYHFVSLRQIVFGENVQTIGEKAFYKCTSLEQVSFSSGLTTIGDKAFYRCEALTSVVLPDTTKTIGNYAFYRCEALEELVIGRGVTEIGEFAFYACANVKRLYLPATLRSLGKQAFRNCKGLTSVIVSNNIETMGAHAFYGCSSLTIYVEATEAKENWHAHWNSSYRPVVWGCVLSEDNDYVVSFEKNAYSVSNRNATNVISAPERAGYTFLGWHTNSSATQGAYAAESLQDAPDGRRLYAIWAEDVQN